MFVEYVYDSVENFKVIVIGTDDGSYEMDITNIINEISLGKNIDGGVVLNVKTVDKYVDVSDKLSIHFENGYEYNCIRFSSHKNSLRKYEVEILIPVAKGATVIKQLKYEFVYTKVSWDLFKVTNDKVEIDSSELLINK